MFKSELYFLMDKKGSVSPELKSSCRNLKKQTSLNKPQMELIDKAETIREKELDYLKLELISILRKIAVDQLKNLENQEILSKKLKDLGVDSLDITEFTMEIEEKFTIHISEEDYELNFGDINSIAKFLLTKNMPT